jgi:hypothetical protein
MTGCVVLGKQTRKGAFGFQLIALLFCLYSQTTHLYPELKRYIEQMGQLGTYPKFIY